MLPRCRLDMGLENAEYNSTFKPGPRARLFSLVKYLTEIGDYKVTDLEL
jgi:hypothetical protein